MSAPHKIFLITGAGRGIGKGFAEKLLQRPGVTVIAAVRSPERAAILHDLPKADSSKLIIVKLDVSKDEDAAAAVTELQNEHGVKSIDVVIANAGISHSSASIQGTSAEALRDHFNVNTIGPVTLFQAVYPLLKASETGNPIFLPISTLIGSNAAQAGLAGLPPTFSPYGASKAALNWVVTRIHIEEPWLTTFVVHPGLVTTDMSEDLVARVKEAGQGDIVIDVDTSVSGLLKIIDGATREETGGSFKNFDGSALPW